MNTNEYICSAYGMCGGKCKLTTQAKIENKEITCPKGTFWATPVHWIILTDEMKEAME